MKLQKIVMAVCAMGLACTQPARAQTTPAGCGSMEDADGELVGFAPYFRDDDRAAVRKTDVRQLGQNDTQEVVTDVRTCRAVLDAALRLIRQYDPTWPEVEAHGYDFTVFRYGTYYAIYVKYTYDPVYPNGPPYLPLLIFRGSDLKYLMTILT